jgi:hypothetical protein
MALQKVASHAEGLAEEMVRPVRDSSHHHMNTHFYYFHTTHHSYGFAFHADHHVVSL